MQYRRNRFWTLLISSLLLICLVSSVQAVEMPPEAPAQLEQILELPEFQPRGASESWYEAKIRALGIYLGEMFERFMKRLSDRATRLNQDSWIVRGLIFVSQVVDELLVILFLILKWSLYIAAFFVLLYVSYLLWQAARRHQARLGLGAWGQADSSTGAESVDPNAPSRYLKEGRLTEALEAVRSLLRMRFQELHRIALSTTDHDALHVIPESDSGRALFEKTTRLFEQMAFAQREANRDELISCIESYLTWSPGEQT